MHQMTLSTSNYENQLIIFYPINSNYTIIIQYTLIDQLRIVISLYFKKNQIPNDITVCQILSVQD